MSEEVKKKHARLDRTCIECGEHFLTSVNEKHVFCPSCIKRKCVRCKIVLSDKYPCPICGKNHGEIADAEGFCKQCIKEIEHEL